MELWLKTLLSLSLAGSALALGLMLVNRLAGRRISSGFVYFAWLLVLLRFALPVPGLLPLPSPAPLSQSGGATQPAAAMPRTPFPTPAWPVGRRRCRLTLSRKLTPRRWTGRRNP